MRTGTLLPLVAILLAAAPAQAQQKVAPDYPTAPAFAPNPAVDSIFAPWNKPNTPGCALGVVRDGHFVYERGYGMANLDYQVPNSPRMVYYIGSDSKQFTAAAIALLALDGKLKLDDDVRKYIPELPDYGKVIRVADLVHHTSGIRDIYTIMSLAGLRLEDVMTDSTMVRLIARQQHLNFTPNTDWLYSNSGYFLLGQIVRRVTGKSLREYADEAIFKPLGMTHTHFHDDPGHVMPWRAFAYVGDGKGGYSISYIQNFDKIGAGGLYSTVEDLQKWDENYYTHQLGGAALQGIIHQRAVLDRGDTLVYAFGNEISKYRGVPIEEHGGALMGYRAHIIRFPTQRFSVIETCNLGSIDPGTLARRVADIYLGAVLGPRELARPRVATKAADAAPWTPDAATLGKFVGDYYSAELDVTYHVMLSGGQLMVGWRATPARVLAPARENTFNAGGLLFTFERAGDDRATAVTVAAGRVTNLRFERSKH